MCCAPAWTAAFGTLLDSSTISSSPYVLELMMLLAGAARGQQHGGLTVWTALTDVSAPNA